MRSHYGFDMAEFWAGHLPPRRLLGWVMNLPPGDSALARGIERRQEAEKTAKEDARADALAERMRLRELTQ